MDINEMFGAWNKGDEQALSAVMPLVYEDLRQIARKHLARSRASHVRSGTLVHQAYLRLVRARGIRCNSREHFLALCSQMIRRIQVDYARKHRSAKRGEGLEIPLDEA